MEILWNEFSGSEKRLKSNLDFMSQIKEDIIQPPTPTMLLWHKQFPSFLGHHVKDL